MSLPAQLSEFQTRVPKPSANALYTLSVGSNDIDDILSVSGLTAQQQTTDINDAVANEIAFVNHLIGDGAKNLLVLDVPDLGKIPEITQGLDNGSNTPSAAYDTLASQLASQYNTALNSQLAAITGATVHVVNTYALLDDAVANPAAYGLTNVTTPVWNGNFTSAGSGTLAATTPATQNQYLFWDTYHPTEAGQQGIADLAEQQLSGLPVLAVADTTTGQPVAAQGTPYTGPVGSLQQQYINITTDNLNITATTPNWFIHSGSGEDAIAVSSGSNVLDGGTGSNFLTGGSGTDTFFVDDRGATTSIWSTVSNFHAGDAVTLWGISPSDFDLSWVDGQGATGQHRSHATRYSRWRAYRVSYAGWPDQRRLDQRRADRQLRYHGGFRRRARQHLHVHPRQRLTRVAQMLMLENIGILPRCADPSSQRRNRCPFRFSRSCPILANSAKLTGERNKWPTAACGEISPEKPNGRASQYDCRISQGYRPSGWLHARDHRFLPGDASATGSQGNQWSGSKHGQLGVWCLCDV